VVIEVPLTAGVVAKAQETIRLQQGDEVVLRVTSDTALELHLHGYDIHADVRLNEVTEMRFTARFTGRFPLAAHVDGNDRNVGYVEVHPK
jgi:FtsP/CotA-like multicopper oxidase with cupredoxin domain